MPLPNGVAFIGSFEVGNRPNYDGKFLCASRQGPVEAAVNDWIIQESDGSGAYPCKPDVFAMKYEPADTTPAAHWASSVQAIMLQHPDGLEAWKKLKAEPLGALGWIAEHMGKATVK